MEEEHLRRHALENLGDALSSIRPYFRDDSDFVRYSRLVYAFDPVLAPRAEAEEIATLSGLWFQKTKPFASGLSRAKSEKARDPLYDRLQAARLLGEASKLFSAAFLDAQ